MFINELSDASSLVKVRCITSKVLIELYKSVNTELTQQAGIFALSPACGMNLDVSLILLLCTL